MTVHSAPSISIQNAYLAYAGRVLFDNLNLNFAAGKLTCLLGPSGIGKTSLLHLLANLIHSKDKTIIHADISTDNNKSLQSQMAYMAQTDLLMPWLSVVENVLLATRLRHYSKAARLEMKNKAHHLLEMVGLSEAKDFLPAQLSGGMRQRVALVRTLIEDKPVVLMDEPFSSLDTITRFKLQKLAAELLKDRTVVLVTHDPQEALRIADEIYVLSGLPAVISSHLKPEGATPRNIGSAQFSHLQANLLLTLGMSA